MLDTVASLARRCLVVVISDFIGTGEWQRPLIRLAHRNDVVALRVVDRADDALPEVGLIVVEDAETGEQLLVDSADPWFRAQLPRRGRRARGRTPVRHASGRGAAAPRRHRAAISSRRCCAVITAHPAGRRTVSLTYPPLLLVGGLLVAAALIVGVVLAGPAPIRGPRRGRGRGRPAGATARSGCGSSWVGSSCWRLPWPGRPLRCRSAAAPARSSWRWTCPTA